MRYFIAVILTSVSFVSQAQSYQDLNSYVKESYGEESQIYLRTDTIFKQFEKEAAQRLPELAQEVYERQPKIQIKFSNITCSILENSMDYMPYCTYVFTSYLPHFDAKGILAGQENKHIYCSVPMAIDFKLAVNYTWFKVYLPAIEAGLEPNLLEYPPAGDPTQKAFNYLQDCLNAKLSP